MCVCIEVNQHRPTTWKQTAHVARERERERELTLIKVEDITVDCHGILVAEGEKEKEGGEKQSFHFQELHPENIPLSNKVQRIENEKLASDQLHTPCTVSSVRGCVLGRPRLQSVD